MTSTITMKDSKMNSGMSIAIDNARNAVERATNGIIEATDWMFDRKVLAAEGERLHDMAKDYDELIKLDVAMNGLLEALKVEVGDNFDRVLTPTAKLPLCYKCLGDYTSAIIDLFSATSAVLTVAVMLGVRPQGQDIPLAAIELADRVKVLVQRVVNARKMIRVITNFREFMAVERAAARREGRSIESGRIVERVGNMIKLLDEVEEGGVQWLL